jgi:hypothetical protein
MGHYKSEMGTPKDPPTPTDRALIAAEGQVEPDKAIHPVSRPGPTPDDELPPVVHMTKGGPGVVLDPSYPFEAVLIKMVETHRRKRSDYAGDDGDPNQNFYDTAYQLSGTAGHSVETLIATKQARLRVLLDKHWAKSGQDVAVEQNEPISDTLLDRAVYSVLAMLIWEEHGYEHLPIMRNH